jgi:hypothetical protein
VTTIPTNRLVPVHSEVPHTGSVSVVLRCVCQSVSTTTSEVPAGAAIGAAPARGPGSDFLPLLRANLSTLVATNKLEAFYPPQRLEEILSTLAQVDFRCAASCQNRESDEDQHQVFVLGPSLVPTCGWISVRAQSMPLSG